MADIRWVTAFVDVPGGRFDEAAAYWCAVTGATLSPRRGLHQEFATVLPPDGDAYLRVQAVDGLGGVHLDLHTDDLPGLVETAARLGAQVLAGPGHVLLRSPGGFTFCVVAWHGEATRPAPVRWPRGSSLVDQVCLDIAPDRWEEETTFWAALTGWELRTGSRPEFAALSRPPGQPLRLLLQRLDRSPAGAGVSAHLDLACTDRDAEVSRHHLLGASTRFTGPSWTTLRTPAGGLCCATDRDPDTGLLHP